MMIVDAGMEMGVGVVMAMTERDGMGQETGKRLVGLLDGRSIVGGRDIGLGRVRDVGLGREWS
jgi:hypothetical protein